MALLLRKDSGICLQGLFHPEIQCFLNLKRRLCTHLCVSLVTEHPGHLTLQKYTSFVIMLEFTNTTVGTNKPVGGLADHPDVCL